MQTGDRVVLAENDSVIGRVVRVDSNGWVVVRWDDWYGHPDDLQRFDGQASAPSGAAEEAP